MAFLRRMIIELLLLHERSWNKQSRLFYKIIEPKMPKISGVPDELV